MQASNQATGWRIKQKLPKITEAQPNDSISRPTRPKIRSKISFSPVFKQIVVSPNKKPPINTKFKNIKLADSMIHIASVI